MSKMNNKATNVNNQERVIIKSKSVCSRGTDPCASAEGEKLQKEDKGYVLFHDLPGPITQDKAYVRCGSKSSFNVCLGSGGSTNSPHQENSKQIIVTPSNLTKIVSSSSALINAPSISTRDMQQKQIRSKILDKAYPKMYHKNWPLIPVYDDTFASNYGLQYVYHYLDTKARVGQKTAINRVIITCHYCGLDYTPAWQIQRINSKRLPLCEACDLQEIKSKQTPNFRISSRNI